MSLIYITHREPESHEQKFKEMNQPVKPELNQIALNRETGHKITIETKSNDFPQILKGEKLRLSDLSTNLF